MIRIRDDLFKLGEALQVNLLRERESGKGSDVYKVITETTEYLEKLYQKVKM